MARSTELLTLTAGRLRLELAPGVGGGVARFDRDGEALLRAAPCDLHDPLDAACFPLVPFSNRIRDGRFSFDGREVILQPNLPGQRHPLHGQGWRAPWTVRESGAATALLAFSHPPGDWPWAYEARQAFALDPAGLTVHLSATNDSDRPMPCGLGLHPYFPCDGDTVLDSRADGVWTIDAEIMPVQRVPAGGRYSLRGRRVCGADLDNGYDGWCGQATIAWPARGVELTLQAPEARWFQLYAPSAGGLFAAEGVTHANAALNLPRSRWKDAGVVVLRPGETFGLTTRFGVRSLP